MPTVYTEVVASRKADSVLLQRFGIAGQTVCRWKKHKGVGLRLLTTSATLSNVFYFRLEYSAGLLAAIAYQPKHGNNQRGFSLAGAF